MIEFRDLEFMMIAREEVSLAIDDPRFGVLASEIRSGVAARIDKTFEKYRDLTLRVAKKERTNLERRGYSTSRVSLTAEMVKDSGEQGLGVAKSSLLLGQLPNFIAFFDYSYTEFMVGNELQVIEEFIGRGIPQDKAREFWGDESPDFFEEVSNKQLLLSGAKLLKRDPSGFCLVDELVNYFKGESTSLGTRKGDSPTEFVFIGAELARAEYKKIYQMVAPLYPSK